MWLVAANPGFAPWAGLTRPFGAQDDQFPKVLLHLAEWIPICKDLAEFTSDCTMTVPLF